MDDYDYEYYCGYEGQRRRRDYLDVRPDRGLTLRALMALPEGAPILICNVDGGKQRARLLEVDPGYTEYIMAVGRFVAQWETEYGSQTHNHSLADCCCVPYDNGKWNPSNWVEYDNVRHHQLLRKWHQRKLFAPLRWQEVGF